METYVRNYPTPIIRNPSTAISVIAQGVSAGLNWWVISVNVGCAEAALYLYESNISAVMSNATR